jgi:predicted transcriptional regulator YdeE/uncharacterized protein YndB with AHSA1/START domain
MERRSVLRSTWPALCASSGSMPAYQIERSVEVSAPPAKVFDTIADFNVWKRWSPWLISDPEANVTVTGNPGEAGQLYTWEGEVTGSGEMRLLEADRGRHLKIDLRFLKPFKSTAAVAFDFQPGPSGGTRVKWRMEGSMPWFLFWMIPMMKTFLGMDFHRGLLMVKDWVESGRIDSKVTPHEVEQVGPMRVFGVRAQAHVEAVGPEAKPALERCERLFDQHGLQRTGACLAAYHKMDVKRGMLDFTIGFVVSDTVALPAGSGLSEWRLPLCRAFRVEHLGAYHHLGNGWSVANTLARHRKLKQSNAGAFEVYRSTPKDAPPGSQRVDIYLPLKGR